MSTFSSLTNPPLPSTFSTAQLAGMGCDLVQVDRIQHALAQHGERFIQRILGLEEQQAFAERYAQHARRGVLYLATRFAVKEAFSKAIGIGMHEPMRWTRVQTLQQPSGQPFICLQDPLRAWFTERFGAHHVSLSDEKEYALAIVIVEARP